MLQRHSTQLVALMLASACTLTPGGKRVRVVATPPPACERSGTVEVTEDCTHHIGKIGGLTADAIDTCRHWALVNVRNHAAEAGAGAAVVEGESLTNGRLMVTAGQYCSSGVPPAVPVLMKPGESEGAMVRFEQDGSEEAVIATVLRLTPESLTYRAAGAPSGADAVEVPLREVTNLELGHQGKPVVGAAIGVVVGTLTGMGIAVATTEPCPPQGSFCGTLFTDEKRFVAGGFVGMLTGAAVGALVGLVVGPDTWVPAEVR